MKRVRKPKRIEIPDYFTFQDVDTNVYRKIPASEMTQITCSSDIVDFVRPNWSGINHTETMKAVFLSRSNKIVGTKIISTGGISSVLVDVRVIFQAALLCNATSLILVHNHPSGETVPSDHDNIITRKVKDAGIVLDIKLLDHLIITDTKYYSFADNGML
jgi:DNA repair protein RadC